MNKLIIILMLYIETQARKKKRDNKYLILGLYFSLFLPFQNPPPIAFVLVTHSTPLLCLSSLQPTPLFIFILYHFFSGLKKDSGTAQTIFISTHAKKGSF